MKNPARFLNIITYSFPYEKRTKNGQALDIQRFVHVMVQLAGIEPARFIQPQDFKSDSPKTLVLSALCHFIFPFYINHFVVFLFIVRIGFFAVLHI